MQDKERERESLTHTITKRRLRLAAMFHPKIHIFSLNFYHYSKKNVKK